MGSNMSRTNMLFTEGKKLTPNLILFQTKFTNENTKLVNSKNNEDSEINQ
jgi:hypothetical protein